MALSAVALLGLWRGATGAAALAAGLAVVLTIAAAAIPVVGPWLDRAAARLGAGAALVIGALGAGILELTISLPGRLLAPLRRRDPLTGRRRSDLGTWRTRTAPDGKPARPFATDVPGRAVGRGRWPRPANVLALAAVLVVVDLTLGSTVETIAPTDPHQPPAETLTSPPEPDLPLTEGASASSLARRPALQHQPQAASCLAEYDRVEYRFRAYLGPEPVDQRGRCVTIQDHQRVTWQPATSSTRPLPIVWVLGGSTVFGAGQRDDHTIPSELARAAAAAGHPIHVVNLGQPGFTTWQEATLLEERLAAAPRPDLIVIYDGANDVLLHDRYPVDEPTAFPTTAVQSVPPGSVDRLLRAWARYSLVHRVWSALAPAPAGALTRSAIAPTANDPRPSTATIARQTTAVRGRSLAFARRVAAAHDVPLLSYFQPARLYDTIPSADLVRRSLPAGDHDLSHVLDRLSTTYYDSVHTNEAGAAAVAAALWQQIAPTLTGGA